MHRAQSILKNVFGFTNFWPLQEQIIAHLLEKKDALIVMPTGGGKSLCYQIPGMIFDGLTIVVSPLISLMKDQVDQLREYGVPSLFLNSTLGMDAYRENVGKLRENKVNLLYLSPETLLAPRTLALLSELTVDCIAIDEAHCISEWGHDFRPEYRQLAEVRAVFPDACCVALTATATPRVREDIRCSLHIEGQNEYVGSFNRPNLFLEVAPKTDPLDQALSLLDQYPQESGIIYCATRRQTDELTAILQRKGYSVLTMRGFQKKSAPKTRSVSAATISASLWRRSLSVWGSTNPMSGLSSTTICRKASTTTIRRSDARDGTACPPIVLCCSVTGTSTR
ncbi:MAG: recQ [Syntrophaceae bacterium]|nr:MAG: recQ [Syntrophaceae bacterium]